MVAIKQLQVVAFFYSVLINSWLDQPAKPTFRSRYAHTPFGHGTEWSTDGHSRIWATSWENLFMTYANNKCTDQPAHPRSLTSTFVVRCLDCIIPLVSISERSSLSASFCEWAGRFESYLVANPKDRFSWRGSILIVDQRFPWALVLWATTWQNQQNECVPSDGSDQPGHPPSLIRVFVVRWMGS